MALYKKDPAVARRRVEAWWEHAVIDRVVIQVRAVCGYEPETPPASDLARYYTDPELVIPRAERRLAHTYQGGEAFPFVVPYGPVAALAGFYGCPLEFSSNGTVWSESIADDPSGLPDLGFDATNPWWQTARRLIEAFVERADGYSVGVPDLNGPTETLARLRGTEAFAVDFIDQPAYIRPAIEEITDTWFRYYQECNAPTERTGGHFHWMGLWSDVTSIDLQSDFSCMISPAMFNEHFLPSIERQTRLVDRTMYHLDGPGAIKHLDALLELPELDGIQWVPGTGHEEIGQWIPLLKRIQAAGKLVLAYCTPAELETVLRELEPEGLMLATGCEDEEEGERLLDSARKWTAEKQ